jgi:hypothetical protein
LQDRIEELKSPRTEQEQTENNKLSVEVAFSDTPPPSKKENDNDDSLSPQPKDLLEIVLHSMWSIVQEGKKVATTTADKDEETLNAQS